MRIKFKRCNQLFWPLSILLFITCLLILNDPVLRAESSAQDSPDAPNNVSVVPTFHSVGIVWKPANASAAQEAKVRFRPQGNGAWREGHPLWYAGDGEYRGSLVELKSGTGYEIELNNGQTSEKAQTTTWSETFPIADTVYVDSGSKTLRIDRSGSASGYILYTPAPGSDGVIDVQGNAENNIRVEAHHVIIRGFTLRNAEENAIELEDDTHDVVIEGNDISGWGRIDERDGWGVNQDSAIFSSANDLHRIIVQRNQIHHPRSDSNNWSEESYSTYGGRKHHPEGPQAIYFGNSQGNHVIRFNEIYSDEDHKFNDCIGGGANGGPGFPGHNSDIYGNIVQDCWDDGLEIEGYNQNVRIWGNYTNRTYMHIATRPTQEGPLYIWRNVANASRKEKGPNQWDSDNRGHFLKSGNLNDKGGGRVYVYHNTMLQNEGPAKYNLEKPVGSYKGLSGAMRNYVSRNNIFYVLPGGESIDQEKQHDNNDFDYDLYNGDLDRISGHERNGISGSPRFAVETTGATLTKANHGLFYLDSSSPGFDDGLLIPNFNDSFVGDAPDMGAHEAGTGAMQFGVDAQLNISDTQLPDPSYPAPKLSVEDITDQIFLPFVE